MLTAMRVTGASILMLSLMVSFALAQGEPLRPAVLVPDELTWAPGPAGALLARVVSDSTKPGIYVVRARFPAGFRVPPHFHPDDRIVTVLSGTVYVGYGEQFDESKMKALPAGSVWTERQTSRISPGQRMERPSSKRLATARPAQRRSSQDSEDP